MTELSSKLKAINCVTCAASLPILGGSKIKSVTCGHCGTMMDRHNDLARLQKYRGMPRPVGPLSIGMSGELNGVRQTVVGVVGVATDVDEETYSWTDYQLYSPTHGYSWLTWNNGHAVHSRKIKGDLPSLEGRYRMERIDILDQTFRFVERYESRITYVEGELTWLAVLGGRTDAAEAAAAPHGYSTSKSGSEIEHMLQTYIPRSDLVAAFDLKGILPKAIGIHPTQPFSAPFHKFIAKEAIGFAALCIVIGIALSVWSNGRIVAEGFTDPQNAGLSMAFESDRPNALTQFFATRSISVEIGNTEFFNVAFIHQKSRTEQKALLRPQYEKFARPVGIRLEEPGNYRVSVQGVPYYKDDPIPSLVKVSIIQGRASVVPLGWLAMLFCGIALSYFARKLHFSAKRWQMYTP